MGDAPRDAQRHDLPARRVGEARLERVEIESLVAVGDRQADPLRRLIAAEVARAPVEPVEPHPPLDPVADVDDLQTERHGGLDSDGRDRRSADAIITLHPSTRSAITTRASGRGRT